MYVKASPGALSFSLSLVFVGVISLGGCGAGALGDDCDTESDCSSGKSCVECSIRNTCYLDELLDDDAGFERACSAYGSGKPTDSRYGGGSSSGGGGSSSSSSGGACAYFDTRLNRLLCNPNSSSSGCSGKYLGNGSSCANFTCSSKTDPRTCTSAGSSSGGGSSGGSSSGGGSSSCDASVVWKCANDGQATPMCQWACTQSGSQRTQTCEVLASMMDKSPGSCCTVCQ